MYLFLELFGSKLLIYNCLSFEVQVQLGNFGKWEKLLEQFPCQLYLRYSLPFFSEVLKRFLEELKAFGMCIMIFRHTQYLQILYSKLCTLHLQQLGLSAEFKGQISNIKMGIRPSFPVDLQAKGCWYLNLKFCFTTINLWPGDH